MRCLLLAEAFQCPILFLDLIGVLFDLGLNMVKLPDISFENKVVL